MTLVIAVPFGFAIRDSVKGNDRESKQEHEAKVAREAEEQAELERIKAQKAEYEHEKAVVQQRLATFDSLLGKQRGTIGDKLGVQIGDATSPELEGKLDSLTGLEDRDGERPGLQVDANDKIVSLSFPIGDDHCPEMREALVKAWGMVAGDIWADPVGHRRASIGGLMCVLHFDAYVDDKTWVANAMPALIGKTPKQAIKAIGPTTAPQVEGEDRDLSWYFPGATTGKDSTEVVASVFEGKIGLTTATTTVTAEQARELVAAIAKQLGAQPEDEGIGSYLWRKKLVEVTFNNDSSRFTLAHGPGVGEP